MLLPRGVASAFAEGCFLPTLSQPGLFGIGKFGQHHHRLNGFVRVPIQTGQCLALVENRKAEFDMFENPSIFLTFRENFYALDETVHEGLFLQIGELVVQLVEVEQELIDVVGGNPALADVVHAGLHLGDADLDGGDLVVDPVLPLLQVLRLAGVMRVVEIERVDLLAQPVLGARELTELLAQGLHLRVELGGVQLAADLLPDALLKGGGVDQLVDDLLHRAVDDFLAPLVVVVTALAVHMQAVLAGVVEVVAVIGSVALLLAVHVAVHAAAADGALEQPGQDVLVVKAVCLELALVGLLALLLRKLPVLLGDDGLVDAVVERVVLLLDDVVLVAGAGDLLVMSASVRQLAAVHWIVKYADEEGTREGFPLVVVTADLAVSVLVEPVCDSGGAHGGVDVLVIDDADDLGLFLGNLQVPVHELVAVGREAAVPFALAGILPAALHRLHEDVLALNLSDGGEDGNHQLAAVLGGINAVLHADQVDAKVLHPLQGGQHVRGVAAEAGELEHQHEGDAVLAGFDVPQHAKKLRAALDVLAGFPLVAVFPGDEHVLELRVLAQLVLLRVQAVAVHLHGGGDVGIDVAFHSLHGFSSRWSGFVASACSSSSRRNLS